MLVSLSRVPSTVSLKQNFIMFDGALEPCLYSKISGLPKTGLPKYMFNIIPQANHQHKTC